MGLKWHAQMNYIGLANVFDATHNKQRKCKKKEVGVNARFTMGYSINDSLHCVWMQEKLLGIELEWEFQIQDGKEMDFNSNSVVWLCMILKVGIKG